MKYLFVAIEAWVSFAFHWLFDETIARDYTAGNPFMSAGYIFVRYVGSRLRNKHIHYVIGHYNP